MGFNLNLVESGYKVKNLKNAILSLGDIDYGTSKTKGTPSLTFSFLGESGTNESVAFEVVQYLTDGTKYRVVEFIQDLAEAVGLDLSKEEYADFDAEGLKFIFNDYFGTKFQANVDVKKSEYGYKVSLFQIKPYDALESMEDEENPFA